MAKEHNIKQKPKGEERKMELAQYADSQRHAPPPNYGQSQYYYPQELEGQFNQPYGVEYEFLNVQPPLPEDLNVSSSGAGMAAAPSGQTGYESPLQTATLIENQGRPVPGPGAIPMAMSQHHHQQQQHTHHAQHQQQQHAQQVAIATAPYYRGGAVPPQNVSCYPIANQPPRPIRATGRHPSSSASNVLVDTDQDGIVWIKFEYTRNRVKWLYRVRCDIDAVNEEQLSTEFKRDNCIYPKAMVPAEEYTGHRQKYETECNHLGWRLALLNPDLRSRRGLIQRAVDSYRNSSGDISVRSRRVRRLAKQQVAPRR